MLFEGILLNKDLVLEDLLDDIEALSLLDPLSIFLLRKSIVLSFLDVDGHLLWLPPSNRLPRTESSESLRPKKKQFIWKELFRVE